MMLMSKLEIISHSVRIHQDERTKEAGEVHTFLDSLYITLVLAQPYHTEVDTKIHTLFRSSTEPKAAAERLASLRLSKKDLC